MKIIISPAKKMNIDTDSLNYISLPKFLNKTQIILDVLKDKSYSDLKNIWKCNDDIAILNYSRLENMNLSQNLTPAILSYEGIQYKYMAASVFDKNQFNYINKHLRILSGFYGVLTPFCGVSPYRLEMQAKLSINEYKNLYEFWKEDLIKEFKDEDFIINLASKEYSKAVLPHINARVINCTFAEIINEKPVEKGTMCKMARGEMVRFLAKNNTISPNDIKNFNKLNYKYDAKLSTSDNYVFIKHT